jgi:hypothetical protein
MKTSRTVSIMAWAAPAVLLWGLVVTASLGAEPIA